MPTWDSWLLTCGQSLEKVPRWPPIYKTENPLCLVLSPHSLSPRFLASAVKVLLCFFSSFLFLDYLWTALSSLFLFSFINSSINLLTSYFIQLVFIELPSWGNVLGIKRWLNKHNSFSFGASGGDRGEKVPGDHIGGEDVEIKDGFSEEVIWKWSPRYPGRWMELVCRCVRAWVSVCVCVCVCACMSHSRRRWKLTVASVISILSQGRVPRGWPTPGKYSRKPLKIFWKIILSSVWRTDWKGRNENRDSWEVIRRSDGGLDQCHRSKASGVCWAQVCIAHCPCNLPILSFRAP